MKRISKKALALSLLASVVLTVLGTVPVSAASNPAEAILTCDSRATIIADLKNGYSEQPIALGVTSAGTVMELWTAADGDTWTLVVTLGNGDSCVVGAGDGWTNLQKTANGKIL